MTARIWDVGLARAAMAVVVLALGFGLGYYSRQGTVEGLGLRLGERGQQLSRTREALSQEEDARFQALLEKSDLTQEKTRLEKALEETRTDLTVTSENLVTRSRALRQAMAEVELLRPSLEEHLAVERALMDAFLLSAEAMSTSLDIVDVAVAEAALLAGQGFLAARAEAFGRASSFFRSAAQHYEEARAALEGMAARERELTLMVPAEVRRVYTQAAERTQAEMLLTAASAAEYTGAAKLYQVTDESLRVGEAATEEDQARWAALLDEAAQDLQDGLAYLDQAVKQAPRLQPLVKARRMDFLDWLDFLAALQIP